MPFPFDRDLESRIADNLAGHDRLTIDDTGLRSAAVTIAVVPTTGGAAGFILTRRTRGMRSHSAQYALPGGRVDPGETAEITARRELSEEVGVVAPPASVLGLLDDYRTRSGYLITPVVVWVDSMSGMQAQPSEVDEIHVIELDELDRPDSPRWVTIPESERKVLQLPLRNRLIHAPTGALLYQFREVALWGRPTRTHDVEEPVWAWG